MRTTFSWILPLTLAAVLVACGGASSPEPATNESTPSGSAAVSEPATAAPLPEDAPRLVLLITIDQMRADYLDRFAPLWTGGFARLREEGVIFTRARHDHAATSTAPGHATLATGRHPSGHGIIANWWIDRALREEVYAVENDEGETTPERLLASTFGDWLKAASPESKVFAASGKDRAAVLTAGTGADAAFWYDKKRGRFTSSSFYSDDLSADFPWIDSFHADRWVDGLFGTAWEPLAEVGERGGEFGIVEHGAAGCGGICQGTFPHPLGDAQVAPDGDFYETIYDSPFVDTYLGRFAAALVEGEALGADAATDFLSISFSAVDTVGHDFGPDSPEILDTLLRLDRTLGEFLDAVDASVGLENVVLGLTSDHGVSELPELVDGEGGRLDAAEITCFQRAGRALEAHFGEGPWVARGLFIDRARAEAEGIDPVAIENALRDILTACPRIERVWTRTELLAGPEDPVGRLFAHSFHAERSPDVAPQLAPHVLTRPSGTSHGSPYDYDTDVPFVLWVPGAAPARVDEPVRTVDMAPTLATLIGLETPEDLDGAAVSLGGS